MTISIKHATTASGTEAGDGEIGKTEWNEAHTLTLETGKLLGRTTAGAGAVEEISLLDEDDMASDSATAVPTQQSVKAYIDNKSSRWNVVGTAATTSGTSVTISGISSGVSEVMIILDGVSCSTSDSNMHVYLGDAGGIETSGYSIRSYSVLEFDKTHYGSILLSTSDGLTWIMQSNLVEDSSGIKFSGPLYTGIKTLTSELTQIQLLLDTNAFDAGSVTVWER